jgi:O-antigen ligase/Flp pilus assembly protein TadD
MVRCCARAAEFVWLAAVVTVPLVMNPWECNAFELPKAVWLQTLGLLGGLVGLIQIVEARAGGRSASRRGPVTPVIWLALTWGLAMALATAFSVDPRLSLWGSHERQQGLCTLLGYLALFLLIAANLRSRPQVDRLFLAMVWGSAPLVAYGLVQAAGLDPLDWHTDAASPVLSTLGRANFLGSYLVLVLPVTLRQTLLARRPWPYAVLAGGQLACLAFSQARGAWIGLGAAALTFGLAWAVVAGKRRLALMVMLGTALGVAFVASLNWPGSPLASLGRLSGLDRLATLARLDAGSTAARLTIWRATLPLIAARPWLGYGPEAMRAVFAHVFPPQLVYYQGRHVSVDRAHNLWLDLGMSAGLVGLVAFTALLAGVGWITWHRLRAASDRWEQVTWVALAAALAGHLVDLQFGFDLTAGATFFWLLLGLSAAMGRPLVAPMPGEVAFPKLNALLLYLPPGLATLSLVGLIGLRPFLADVSCWQAQQGTRQVSERLVAAQRAVQLWALEPEYRVRLAWIYLQLGQFPAGETQLAAAGSLQPDAPGLWAARGEFYALWGQVEPDRYRQAEAAYRRALDLAPNIAAYHTSLGLVLAQQGRLEEGLLELERATDLDATDATAYRHLSDLNRALGLEAQADWALRQAIYWERKEEAQMKR